MQGHGVSRRHDEGLSLDQRRDIPKRSSLGPFSRVARLPDGEVSPNPLKICMMHQVFGIATEDVPPNDAMSCFVGFAGKSWDNFKNPP